MVENYALGNYAIRRFSGADLEKVMSINRECLPENYTPSFYLDLHRNFPNSFMVAEFGGEILGYVMCRVEWSLSEFDRWRLTKKGHVVSIAVVPGHRRKGIGRALMIEAMNALRDYGVNEIYLEVRVTNDPAISLYKELRFEIVNRIRHYYSDGEDAYVMAKRCDREAKEWTGPRWQSI
jgi:ribosomal-protein-alanine N-acetyltransferase